MAGYAVCPYYDSRSKQNVDVDTHPPPKTGEYPSATDFRFSVTVFGPGGPGDPTGNTIAADYVYHMQFEGDRIKHMTKIWNDTISLQQLGWG